MPSGIAGPWPGNPFYAGDLPDVFFGDNSLGDMDILTNLDLFVPIEEYIDQYCPNIFLLLY